MNFDQPKIKIHKTNFEKIFDAIALLVLLACVVYLFANWSSIPAQVPTHFNAAGDPDGWSGKGSIWLLPAIGLLIWAGLGVLERYPHVYNHLVKITDENAERQYKNAVLMINFMKNSILILFMFIVYQSIEVALKAAEGLGGGFIFVFIGVIFGNLFFFLIRSWRLQ